MSSTLIPTKEVGSMRRPQEAFSIIWEVVLFYNQIYHLPPPCKHLHLVLDIQKQHCLDVFFICILQSSIHLQVLMFIVYYI